MFYEIYQNMCILNWQQMWKIKRHAHAVTFLGNYVVRSGLFGLSTLQEVSKRQEKVCLCVLFYIHHCVCFRNQRSMGEAVCFAAAHTNSIGLSVSSTVCSI